MTKFHTRETPVNYTITMPEQLGFVFVKGGYDDCTDDLCHDFTRNGLDVLRDARVTLDGQVVDYIYRDSTQEHFYRDMREYLVGRSVTSLVLGVPHGNAQQTVHELKTGANGRENLRHKYKRPHAWIDDEQMRVWQQGLHPQQKELTVMLTQANVFHASDDTADAVETIRRLQQSTAGRYLPAHLRIPRQIGRVAGIV